MREIETDPKIEKSRQTETERTDRVGTRDTRPKEKQTVGHRRDRERKRDRDPKRETHTQRKAQRHGHISARSTVQQIRDRHTSWQADR